MRSRVCGRKACSRSCSKSAATSGSWCLIRIRRPSRDPIIIMPYLGYGTPQKLTVRGRVLEDEGFTATGDADSRWRNLVRFWKRLESDEVPGARAYARCGGGAAEAVTDREGYFRLELATRAKAA